MILLSAHQDTVHNNHQIQCDGKEVQGLLDNIIGMMTIYHVLLEDKVLASFAAKGDIQVWHNRSEEWGALTDDHPKLKKTDLVIVIDVCSDKRYKHLDFSIENCANMSKKDLKGLDAFLKWEGFDAKVLEFNGRPGTEDEAWQFKELGVPVISFIIPVESYKNGWHRLREDSVIDIKDWRVACEGLKRVINFFYSS